MNVVIDANVIAAANFHASHASRECITACVMFLSYIKQNGGCVSVDQNGLIFQEYAKYSSHKGEPGVGDAFFKWLFDHQGYETACEKVFITSHFERGFEEFPIDPNLNNFDRADRKYVAVALASKYSPLICNATDSDWIKDKVALLANNIRVNELCP